MTAALPSAPLLALLSAFFFGLSTVAVQPGLRYTDSATGTAISTGAGALAFWVTAPLYLEPAHWHSPAVPWFLLGGMFRPFLTVNLLYAGARLMGPTITGTVASSSPLFSAAFAVLILGERLPLPVGLGTVAVVVGLMALSWRGQAERRWPLRALLFPFGAALLRGIVHPINKHGIGLLPNPFVAGLSAYTVSFALTVVNAWWWRPPGGPRLGWRALAWFSGMGLSSTTANLLLFTAFRTGDVVHLVPIVASAPVFTMLLSWLFLRGEEQLGPRVVAGVFLVVPGVILVNLYR